MWKIMCVVYVGEVVWRFVRRTISFLFYIMSQEKILNDLFKISEFNNVVSEESFAQLSAENILPLTRKVIYEALQRQRQETLAELKRNIEEVLKRESGGLAAADLSLASSLPNKESVVDALRHSIEGNKELLNQLRKTIQSNLDSSHRLMDNLHMGLWTTLGDNEDFECSLESSTVVLLPKHNT